MILNKRRRYKSGGLQVDESAYGLDDLYLDENLRLTSARHWRIILGRMRFVVSERMRTMSGMPYGHFRSPLYNPWGYVFMPIPIRGSKPGWRTGDYRNNRRL